MSRIDVLVVAIDTTAGWRGNADALVGSLSRAGASVEKVGAGPVPRVRTLALTDFVEARAARRAAERGIAEHDPAAIVYCSVSAALLWPRQGAIWFDSWAAENRPGRHGVWQRPVERRRLAQAPLLMSMSERPELEQAVLVPAPVKSTLAEGRPPRDIAALAYAGDPEKRRLGYLLEVWERCRREGETLVVAGTDELGARPGVEVVGPLPPAEYRALLRRTRVFVAAPRFEDYGTAPLEALADGCLLATTPAPGPYPARELARTLDPRLVDERLERALRTALDDPLPEYSQRAAELLEPFGPEAVDRTVARDVLPRLMTRWKPA